MTLHKSFAYFDLLLYREENAGAPRQHLPWFVLIDGARLAELMIDYGVGVSTRESYVLKRAGEDYFAES